MSPRLVKGYALDWYRDARLFASLVRNGHDHDGSAQAAYDDAIDRARDCARRWRRISLVPLRANARAWFWRAGRGLR